VISTAGLAPRQRSHLGERHRAVCVGGRQAEASRIHGREDEELLAAACSRCITGGALVAAYGHRRSNQRPGSTIEPQHPPEQVAGGNAHGQAHARANARQPADSNSRTTWRRMGQ